MEITPRFEFILDGVIISLEAQQLTIEQARQMLLAAYPERKLDIYRGLKNAIIPDEAA